MPFDSLPTENLTETEQETREDLYRWLDLFPDRVPALLDAVRQGRLDGSTYHGKCRCVIGYLSSRPLSDAWEFGSDRPDSIEEFVQGIIPGDTPSNSPVMAHLERWILEWQIGDPRGW